MIFGVDIQIDPLSALVALLGVGVAAYGLQAGQRRYDRSESGGVADIERKLHGAIAEATHALEQLQQDSAPVHDEPVRRARVQLATSDALISELEGRSSASFWSGVLSNLVFFTLGSVVTQLFL